LFSKHRVRAREIGKVGGERLVINDLVDVAIADLSAAFYSALPLMMQEPGR
jgi:hypothetical protein